MRVITVLLACFDHAHPGPKGTYWAWQHPDLSSELLDSLYYRVIASHVNESAAIQSRHASEAGAATIADWVCWYFIADLGLDGKGRRGRFGLICAFVRRTECFGFNCCKLLASTELKSILEKHQGAEPVSKPPSLTLDIAFEKVKPTSCEPATGQQDFHGQLAWEKAGNIIATLSGSFVMKCRFSDTDGNRHANLLVELPEPIASSKSEPAIEPPRHVSPAISNPPLPSRPRQSQPNKSWSSDFRLSFLRKPIAMALCLFVAGGIGFSLGSKSGTRKSKPEAPPTIVTPSSDTQKELRALQTELQSERAKYQKTNTLKQVSKEANKPVDKRLSVFNKNLEAIDDVLNLIEERSHEIETETGDKNAK